jgi:hypothetical protein
MGLALLDPDSPAVRVYQNGQFELYEPEAVRLPRAPTSADWYRGWRDPGRSALARSR